MEFPGEKLVIKLWETLAEKGVGSLLSPWQTIREGRARSEVRRQELLMLAQAEVDAADIRAGRQHLKEDGTLRLLLSAATDRGAADPSERVEPTLSLPNLVDASIRASASESARREINASKAIIYAEEALAADSQIPPDRSVEDDWLFTWREYAGRVSTEDLQQLWGRVLAGEVKSPGSFSFRALEFLKGLSKLEAEQISMLASFVIEGRIVRSLAEYLKDEGVSFSLLLGLQELGLLSGVEALGLNITYKSMQVDRYVKPLRSNGKVLMVENEDPGKTLTLKVYVLTAVGSQIMGLGNFPANLDYLRLIAKEILKQGFTVTLADWVQTSESEGRYSNAEKIDA